MMLRIIAPHFIAGIIQGGAVAPIIKYMKGWKLRKILDYCKFKGWTVEIIEDLEATALDFAIKAHEDQIRKYTKEPYINHCIAVAKLVKTVPHTVEMVCAAILHDTLEDTQTTKEGLIAIFGIEITNLVVWLTDQAFKGNRAQRKKLQREYLRQAPADAKTVKLADLINNADSVIKYDPGFARVFMNEFELLLKVLTEGDSVLYMQAEKIIKDYRLSNPAKSC